MERSYAHAHSASPAPALIETAGEFHAMATEHLHTPHSHASQPLQPPAPVPHPSTSSTHQHHASMSSSHLRDTAGQAQAHAVAHAHAQHAAHQAAQAYAAGAAGAGVLAAAAVPVPPSQNPEDFMHPYMQSILGMLHNELAEKNLQVKSLHEHLQDYKVLKYMSKQTERDAAKSADEVRTCKNEINNLRSQLAAEKQARALVEAKYKKLVSHVARAKNTALGAKACTGVDSKSEGGLGDPASTPEANSTLAEPQSEAGNNGASAIADVQLQLQNQADADKRGSQKSSPEVLPRLSANDILQSIAALGPDLISAADAVTADDGLSPRLPTLLTTAEDALASIDLDAVDVASVAKLEAEGKTSGNTGSTALVSSGDLLSHGSGMLSPSPSAGGPVRATAVSAAGVLPPSTGTTGTGVVDLSYITAKPAGERNPTLSQGSSRAGAASAAPAQNEMHGVISTWGRKVCKGRIRPTSSAEFQNYEFSFDLQDVDPEVEATFYIGDPVVFVALRGYNELRAVNVRLAKPRVGLPPAIFPTNNYFYYIYDIPVTNLSNIDAKLKHELKTRQVMTEYDLLDCYLKVVGQAFHENNITYFGIVSFSEVESYKNFFRRLAECNTNETDPAKKPPMKVGLTRPRGRLEFW